MLKRLYITLTILQFDKHWSQVFEQPRCHTFSTAWRDAGAYV